MLNKAIIMGRITHDLEVRQTQSGTAMLRFNVAVDRGYSKQGEERKADFISCVAWGQRAEFIGKYFGKGRMIALVGSLRTGSYEDKNGTKHYTTDLFAEDVSFTGEKSESSGQSSYGGSYSGQNSAGSTQTAPQTNVQSNELQSNKLLGDLSDFEDILSDDGVPF
ncbi:single-stranded DNA-binding protein [uncultured Ruminococcus sp.]|uniref:single-stranded DNA-binding protein n=1 Tax=uncultured Ruminococcus sp. TaxID=165186 RepID=UPI0025E6F249|nr:single-stranded DNA-binding protein [uncultured Ruminococcus sp.]